MYRQASLKTERRFLEADSSPIKSARRITQEQVLPSPQRIIGGSIDEIISSLELSEGNHNNYLDLLQIGVDREYPTLTYVVELYLCKIGHSAANAMEYFVATYEYNLQEAAALLMDVVMANSAAFVAFRFFYFSRPFFSPKSRAPFF